MAPRGIRKKEKQKKVDLRGFPKGYVLGDDSTVNQVERSTSSTTGDRGDLKILQTSSTDDSDDSGPEIRPAINYSSPDFRKLDSLKRPDILTMHLWSSEDYAEYDAFLIKQWEIAGWCENDSLYVSLRDYKLSWTARTLYGFKEPAHGRVLPTRVQEDEKPDLLRMHKWTANDYDRHDSFLINKWKRLGWDQSDIVYVSIRDPSSMVFKTAQAILKGKKKSLIVRLCPGEEKQESDQSRSLAPYLNKWCHLGISK